MKITDPAHAVRVLESLVEQMKGKNTSGFNRVPSLMCEALVEGAKAVLEEWHAQNVGFDNNKKYARAEDVIRHNNRRDLRDAKIVGLAQAYAPRMAEAGMEVPE